MSRGIVFVFSFKHCINRNILIVYKTYFNMFIYYTNIHNKATSVSFVNNFQLLVKLSILLGDGRSNLRRNFYN